MDWHSDLQCPAGAAKAAFHKLTSQTCFPNGLTKIPPAHNKRQLTVGWEAADEKGDNADQTKQHEGVNVDQTKERWVVQFFLTVSL